VIARAAALLALLLSLALAGCGDDGGGSAEGGGTTTVEEIPAELDFPDDKEAAAVLDDFVQAAGRTDYDGMFKLISQRTKARYGQTPAAFARDAGKELAVVLGAMARQKGEYDQVMSKRLSNTWSVAAIRGSVTARGETVHGAYSVPLRRENGKLKIELAGTTTFNPITPEPELKSDKTPEIATELSAGEPILHYYVWVDGTPYPAVVSPDELLLSSAVTTPLRKGQHVVTTFAETQSGAGANAFSFEVG
jgi:hypothetical protein